MRWRNWLGNEHGDLGGRQDREKEAKRQEDIARQNEESQNTLNQFLSQLVPGSEEYNRLQTEGGLLVSRTSEAGSQQDLIRQLGSQLVTQQQQRIAGGGAATALEERTGRAFEGLRDTAGFSPEEQALLNALRGIPGTGEEGQAGGTQDIFSQLVSRAQDPDAAFTSTLSPQLQLLQDQVKARAAQRGLLGSGLELEDLGRSGVELAVREAEAREQFRQQQLNNFTAAYNAGQTLRNREIGVEEALVNLQSGRESNLTGLLQSQTGNAVQNMLDLLGNQTGRAEELRDLASALREAERQSREQFAGNILFPEATIPLPGGGSITTPGGGSAFPQTGPQSPGSLQVAQQTGQTGGGVQPSQASTLSRRKTQGGGGGIEELLAALMGGGS